MGTDFRILGELEVLQDGGPVDLGSPRQRALIATMTDLSITRRCRGVEYRITVSRGNQPGVRVDGAAAEGAVIPYASPGESIDVAITI